MRLKVPVQCQCIYCFYLCSTLARGSSCILSSIVCNVIYCLYVYVCLTIVIFDVDVTWADFRGPDQILIVQPILLVSALQQLP